MKVVIDRAYDSSYGFYGEVTAMTDDWELDGRKLPAQVLEYLRKMAVRAVKEQGYSDWGIGLESPL